MSSSSAARAPRQERSRETWARVLDASLELLQEGGYAALTVDGICARSGTTPPSVYARAGNKEGLLLAIYEHAMARIGATGFDVSDPEWDRLTAAALVRRAVDVVRGSWEDNAAVLRPIVHRAAHDPEIFRRGSRNSHELAADYRAVLAKAGIGERDADATFRLVYAALVERVMYGEGFESSVDLSDRAFRRMLGDAAVRYLQLNDQEETP